MQKGETIEVRKTRLAEYKAIKKKVDAKATHRSIKEIDGNERVYLLYGQTEDEIKLIEQ